MTAYHWQTCRHHLSILKANGVLKQGADGIWFNQRMVDDYAKYQESKANGEKGAETRWGAKDDSPPHKPPPMPKKRIEENKKRSTHSALFLQAKECYPSRDGGQNYTGAWKGWQKALKDKTTPDGHPITEESLLEAVKFYRTEQHNLDNIGTKFVRMMSSFFGRDQHYLEYIAKVAEAKDADRLSHEAALRRQEYLATRQPPTPPEPTPDPEGAQKLREMAQQVGLAMEVPREEQR
jgi:hypothetical protein